MKIKSLNCYIIDDTFTNDWKISKLSNGTTVAFRSYATGEKIQDRRADESLR